MVLTTDKIGELASIRVGYGYTVPITRCRFASAPIIPSFPAFFGSQQSFPLIENARRDGART